MTPDETPDNNDELLLPWHAAGTLGHRDAERIDRAIAESDEMSRRYRLALEERAETVRVNERLAVPSAGATERLLSRIDAETKRAAGRPVRGGIADWIAGQLSRRGPRPLAWSAVAAAFLILVQAGLLGAIYASHLGPARYDTASVPQAEIGVSFVPQATIDEVTKFAETYRLLIVKGPLAGRMFKMRVDGTPMTRDALDQLVKRIQHESSIVRMVAVAE